MKAIHDPEARAIYVYLVDVEESMLPVYTKEVECDGAMVMVDFIKGTDLPFGVHILYPSGIRHVEDDPERQW